MSVNTMLRALYWFVAGGCIGVGVIGILSIGAPLLVLGLILIAIGTIHVGPRELWAALVGCSLLPLLFLLGDLAQQDIQPATTAHSYQVLAIGFGAVALLGGLWGLMRALHRVRAPGHVN